MGFTINLKFVTSGCYVKRVIWYTVVAEKKFYIKKLTEKH